MKFKQWNFIILLDNFENENEPKNDEDPKNYNILKKEQFLIEMLSLIIT